MEPKKIMENDKELNLFLDDLVKIAEKDTQLFTKNYDITYDGVPFDYGSVRIQAAVHRTKLSDCSYL